jgi:hypothetical protein
LAREVQSWQAHGTLIPPDRLDLLYTYRQPCVIKPRPKHWYESEPVQDAGNGKRPQPQPI